MKKFTTALFLCLISFCFLITGCSKAKFDMPQNYTEVSSNGGFVVGAGNYMYFANTFNSKANLTSKADNSGDGSSHRAIKMVEVLREGDHTGWFDIKKQDDKIEYNNVINKIAGFECSNMFVVGKNLYFTTPNVHKNKSNEYNFKLTTLFKIKLDGSDLKEVYTTESENAKFYLQGTSKKTILIFDNSKIKQVDASSGETKTTVVAEDVENVVFPEKLEQDIAWLYYTSTKSEEALLGGNVLKKVSLTTLEKHEVYAPVGETIKILAYEDGRLFYTKSGKETTKGLYTTNFESSSMPSSPIRTLTTGLEDETDIAFITADDGRSAFVFMYDNNLYIQFLSATSQAQAKKISTEETTLQFFNGTYVYYSTENGIYRVSVINAYNNIQNSEEIEVQQISNQKNITNNAMDFDGKYVYFFASQEGQESENKYLFRADVTASQGANAECIAELLEEDVIEEGEETEEETEE